MQRILSHAQYPPPARGRRQRKGKVTSPTSPQQALRAITPLTSSVGDIVKEIGNGEGENC